MYHSSASESSQTASICGILTVTSFPAQPNHSVDEPPTRRGVDVIDATELTVRFGDVLALDSVSLSVDEGEFVTVDSNPARSRRLEAADAPEQRGLPTA